MFSLRRVFWCAGLLVSWAHVAHAQTIPPCGQQLSANAIYRGVPAKSNDGVQGSLSDCEPFNPPRPPCGVGIVDVACSYGEHYQCVEFIRRFYSLRDDTAQQVDTTGWVHLNAVNYYTSPPAGFVALPNGGLVPPAPDDILVFSEGGYGHVAIVKSVTGTAVDLIEENWSKTGLVSIPMTSTGENFTVSSRQGRIHIYTPLGWVRRHVTPPAPLLGTDMPTATGEIAVASYQFLAQQFTLTTPVQVSSIRLQMSGFGTDQFTLWVTNSIGPGTTPSNVLLQTNLTFPNTGGATNGQTVSTTTNLSLNPGTYFLILSATQTLVTQGWITSTTVFPSTVGSVSNQVFSTCCTAGSTNTLFPPASTFSTPGQFRAAFQIF